MLEPKEKPTNFLSANFCFALVRIFALCEFSHNEKFSHLCKFSHNAKFSHCANFRTEQQPNFVSLIIFSSELRFRCSWYRWKA